MYYVIKKSLSYLLLFTMLIGCAVTQPINEADRKRISSVTVSDQVTKPSEIYYMGPGGATGFMFGAVGALVSAPILGNIQAEFQQHVINSGISIEKIVLEEISAAIRQSGKFPLSEKKEAGSAVIKVSVVKYGFSIPTGFSSKLVPILAVRCEMTDASGKMIWSAQEHTRPLGNPVEPVAPEVLRDDPKVIEIAWRAAAKFIAAKMVGQY